MDTAQPTASLDDIQQRLARTQRQIAANEMYQFSLYRIGEDSEAADREADRVLLELSKLRQEARELQARVRLLQANEVSGTYNSTPHKESGI